jgi:NAD-dependent dihydropyrimidine dehydrogenase PreA subunit
VADRISRPEQANNYQQQDRIDRPERDSSARHPVPVRIDYDLCDSTGVCAMVCPEDVLEFKKEHPQVVRPSSCTECWICVENCVSGAIEIG